MKRKILLFLCFGLIVPFVVIGQGLNQFDDNIRKSNIDKKSKSTELFQKLTTGINQLDLMAKSVNDAFLEKVESQFYDGSEFIPSTKVEFSYDNGLKTEKITFSYDFMNPPGWLPQSKEINIYENQLLTSSVTQNHSGQEFENESRSNLTYHQVGDRILPAQEITQVWNPSTSEWEDDERSDFVAENGNLSRIDDYVWEDGEWVIVERMLITEENGDLFLVLQELVEGEWENESRIIYSGQSFFELLSHFIESFDVMEDIGSSLLFFTLIPDFTEQVWTGTEWEYDSRQVSTTITDDNTGEIVQKSILNQMFDGTDWITETEILANYNSSRIVEITWFESDESDESGSEELQPFTKESFSYNEQDLLSEIIQEAFISSMEKSSGSDEETMVTGRTLLTWSEVATTVETDTEPFEYNLGNAYPNPFNPVTVVPFQANRAGGISIKVYDMLGRYVTTIADGVFQAGNHTVQFDASGLSSGVYLIRMQSEDHLQVRRVTLIK